MHFVGSWLLWAPKYILTQNFVFTVLFGHYLDPLNDWNHINNYLEESWICAFKCTLDWTPKRKVQNMKHISGCHPAFLSFCWAFLYQINCMVEKNLVQGWPNFGLITKLTFLLSGCVLVIHNYCQSQISFPAGRGRSTPLSVNRYSPRPKISDQKSNWLYKVKHGVCRVKGILKPQISIKCGRWSHFILDEHVSWSLEAKQSTVPVLFCKIYVTHTQHCFMAGMHGAELSGHGAGRDKKLYVLCLLRVPLWASLAWCIGPGSKWSVWGLRCCAALRWIIGQRFYVWDKRLRE